MRGQRIDVRLSRYGVSAGKLLRTAGPDTLVDHLAADLGADHGLVRLPFYPFEGDAGTVEWIEHYAALVLEWWCETGGQQ